MKTKIHKELSKYTFHPSIDNIHILEQDEYKKLYHEMKMEYDRIKRDFEDNKEEKLHIETKMISKNELKEKIGNTTFFSNEIKKYVMKNDKYIHHFVYDEIEIDVYSSKKKLSKKEKNEIEKMIVLTLMCKDTYDRPNEYHQKITYFPTPFKKNISKSHSHILGPHECNSGLTYVNTIEDPKKNNNGDIILYRKEENMKVLIHELIHSNYRDLMLIKHSDNRDFTKKFCTDYDILLNESYTEFHATIMNVFFVGILENKTENEINQMLQNEIKYGIYVSNHILEHYKIKDLHEIIKRDDFCKKKLHQKTNIISYYLFKPIQMFHLSEMNHFLKNHTEWIQINSKEGVNQYRDKLLEWYMKPEINELCKISLNIKKRNKKNRNKKIKYMNTLRMTLYE